MDDKSTFPKKTHQLFMEAAAVGPIQIQVLLQVSEMDLKSETKFFLLFKFSTSWME